MAYHLHRTGQIATSEGKKLKEYFYRWYNTKPQRMIDLAALQYNELERIDRDNKKNLGKLAHKMDHRTNKIDDLKTQRSFLINKVVLAQRLALARCHFSYKHSLHKAWG